MRDLRRAGFTILELLIVVAIIGVLATIAIANYQNASNRARQKRSMADMRSIAIAWESRATDEGRYNAAGYSLPSEVLIGSDVQGLLIPTYIKRMPTKDGWGISYDFHGDVPIGSSTGATLYAIRSLGRDAAEEGTTYTPGPTTRFDCDIIFANGVFVTYPEGVNIGH